MIYKAAKFEKLLYMKNVLVRWLEMYKWRILFSVILIGFSLILVFQSRIYLLGAVNALRIPYAVMLTAYTLFFFIRGNKILSSGGAIALLILIPGIWKYFKPEQAPANGNMSINKKEVRQADFSLVHFNVKENNKNILALAMEALQSNADVISLQELHAETLQAIDTIMKKKYPYSVSDISVKGFGLAVYSKYPIGERDTIVQKNFPVLTGVIQKNTNAFHFISATTSSPKNDKGLNEQIKQFKIIADYVQQIDSPVIVMGDMNAVPWSEQIETFLRTTRLKDSRKDISGTFPAQSVFVKIPIDYIFYSPQLECIDFKTLSATSSNHLGIMGYYKFRTGNALTEKDSTGKARKFYNMVDKKLKKK